MWWADPSSNGIYVIPAKGFKTVSPAVSGLEESFFLPGKFHCYHRRQLAELISHPTWGRSNVAQH